MIVTNLKDVDRYRNISPYINKAVDYIQSREWESLPADKVRYTIHEGEVEVMRMVYEPGETGTWESHEKMIDIQMLVSGEEIMKFAPTSSLTKDGDIIVEKDFQKWTGTEVQSLIATPEQLIFFFPEDGHKPNLATPKKGTVDKIVFKVKV